MRILYLLLGCLIILPSLAQDSIPIVEKDQETSFTNTELWVVVALALILLFGLYFLLNRRKKRNTR